MRNCVHRRVIAVVAFVSTLSAPLAWAAPTPHLNWGAQISRSQCPAGKLVINVVHKALNDDDSGVAGNSWASDDFVRQIQVVQTGSGSFCANVSYQGTFTTRSGPSPQNTGTVGDGVVGTFEGGYISNFTGVLDPAPAFRNRGSIGEFDYMCDGFFNCPGLFDWGAAYFTTINGSPAHIRQSEP